jgi:hypothetical protein
MAQTIAQVAAHEAGHAVVSMAVGVPIVSISGMVGKHPDSFLVGVYESFSTEIDKRSLLLLEARLTYLCAVGGFAGEVAHEGIIEPKGALDDLTRLRQVHLTDFQIQLLTGVAMEIIGDNRRLWEDIFDTALCAFQGSQNAFIPGGPINRRFGEIGKKFTNVARLDEVLPMD